MTARLVIADRRSLVRAALRALLERDAGADVVAEGGSEVAAGLEAVLADVLLIDIGLLDDAPIAAAKTARPTVRVVVVDVEPDEERLAVCVEAGADGYLSRLHHPADLRDAIVTVMGGHAYVPTEMLGGLLRSLIHVRREQDAAAERFRSLSAREVEVLALLCEGAGGEDIAEKLFISPATVRTHIQNVLKKLDVHSQVEAAAFVRQHGLLDDVGSRP